MVVFRVDKEKNILFMSITGIVPKDKMLDSIELFAKKCTELKEYFTIINDMSLLKISSDHDFDILSKTTFMMKEKFLIGKIIRIIGTNHSYEIKLKHFDAHYHMENIFYVSNKKSAFETLYKL
ncbi:MAG: hypothetical protein PHN18_12965 [Sulfurospirillaceae bacterium]|jgi:hypothetical protein|nr:hypothetical protein [Sulfurospirillaceae bacterium]MDD2827773.1 hypothetical protein [Sulfurospirillaceae bacterium]